MESNCATMAATTNTLPGSWDSLTSTFDNLEISFSQDSSYGSDEVSVSSNNTAPLQTSISTCAVKRQEPSLHPSLKSILKNSCSDLRNDTECESGYGSDGIEIGYDDLSGDEEGDDADMSDSSVWEATSQDVPETREDHTDSFDDSFIGFETSVRFNPEVQYISTPKAFNDEEITDNTDNQMTFHELMLRSLQSRDSQTGAIQSHADNKFEDFTRDAVDVDRQLFVAYMNGIHGILDSTDTKYSHYLSAQVMNIRYGRAIEPMHPDDSPCMYLDVISRHVIGMFRNLLTVAELDDLIKHRKEGVAKHASGDSWGFFDDHLALTSQIECLLEERLDDDGGHANDMERAFFAGSIVYALGTQHLPGSA